MNTETQKSADKLRRELRIVAIAAALTVLLFISQLSSPACVLGTLPDPTDTVTAFFDALVDGEYDRCDELISGYTTLGLGVVPSDESVAELYSEMLGSFSYRLTDEPVVEGSSASVSVELTWFDVSSAIAASEENAAVYMRSAAQGFDGELYNDDGSYTDEYLAAVHAQIIDAVIADKQEYIKTQTCTVALSYENGWYIVPDAVLLKILSGGLM